MPRGTQPAFSLVELLVVVSVIALLLAVLLPGLASAREAGNMAVCATNLDQLFKGAFMHATENEDRLPYYAWMDTRTTREWWVTQVAQAMDDFEAGIFACPSDARPHQKTRVYYSGRSISMHAAQAGVRSLTLPVTYRGSCGLVEDVATGQAAHGGALQARKISSWRQPQRALLLVEARAKNDPSFVDSECFRFRADLGILANPRVRHAFHEDWQRHLGQANYGFIDGHVDTLAPKEAGELANNQEYALP